MNGPEPTDSVICVLTGVEAMRAGMMNAVPGFPSASSTMPKGSFSTSLNVSSSTASTDWVNFARFWPEVILVIHRCSDATTSAEVTFCPSWNARPGRSLKVQVSLSSDTVQVSTICGFGSNFESNENSVS